MRKPIIVGNWKMNKTIAEAASFVEAIEPLLHDDADFGVGAPFLALEKSVAASKHLLIAAQNVHFEDSGAFTGEVSVAMLKEVGVKWCIIGHSERRTYFNETNETVNKKALKLIANGIVPIVCVGETLTQFEAGETEHIVRTQTAEALVGLTGEEVGNLVIAYEPVWAIGTGKNATKEIAQHTCAIVRNEVLKNFGPEAAEKVRIQYGGSVKPDNIKEYMAENDIDGALIGGASLKVDSFKAIIDALKA
jgi:triosephosphate isomerase